MEATIFDIQRFCVHDGPSIRTTFFLAGCPLSCKWCHNPEGLKLQDTLFFEEELCILCGECTRVCKNNAHSVTDVSHAINRTLCVKCNECAKVCPSGALKFLQRKISVPQVIEYAKKDLMFYGSKGGVTFSGGECTVQHEFLISAINALKKENINSCIDTCGYTSASNLREYVPIVDTFLYDIKGFNSNLHKKYTCVSNELILSNLKLLSELNANIWVRIPIIPRYNDNIEEMEQIASFISELKIQQVTIMPYHKLGQRKYKQLGLDIEFNPDEVVSQNTLELIKNIFIKKNIKLAN